MPDFLQKSIASLTPKPRKTEKRNFGMNLVFHSVAKESSERGARKNLIILASSLGISVGIVLFIAGGLSYYGKINSEKVAPLRERLSSADMKIAAIESKAEKLNTFQDQLDTVKTLLENHTYWTQFFTAIETYTLPSVSFESVSMTTQNLAFSTTGYAPDYETVGKQLLVFQGAPDVFTSAKINSANAKIDNKGRVSGVTFSVNLTMNPLVIKKK